jgi:hypothetical protein
MPIPEAIKYDDFCHAIRKVIRPECISDSFEDRLQHSHGGCVGVDGW